jgi:ferritin heavy chain
VALGNFAKYLRHQSDEEREHAKMLIHYQNLRGGRVVMQDVKVANCIDFGQNKFVLQKPEKDEWGTAADALETALALEKKVNQSLLDLHKIASDHSDAQVSTVFF